MAAPAGLLAAVAALVPAIILGQQWWAGPVLAYLLGRILWLRDRRLTLVTGVVVLAVGLRAFSLVALQEHRRALMPHGQRTMTLRLATDSWQENGPLLTGTARDRGGTPVAVQVRLASRAQARQLTMATGPLTLTVQGRYSRVLPPTNVNEFDGRAWLANQGIVSRVSGQVTGITESPASRPLEFLQAGRARLRHYLATLPEPLAGDSQQLLMGERDPALATAMDQAKQLGIIHLFCLSGLHLLVLTRLLRGLLTVGGCTRETSRMVLALIIPVYWVFGGAATSLGRAALMVEFTLLGELGGLRGPTAWAGSLIIQTVVTPAVLLTTGGQLSYLLAFCLTWFHFPSVPVQTVRLALVSLPVVLHANYQFHLLSLGINYLMIPLFSGLIMPLTLLGGLSAWLFPSFGRLVNWGLLAFHRLVAGLAGLPGMVTVGRLPAWLTLALVIVTMLSWERHSRRWLLAGMYLVTWLGIHYPPGGEVAFVDIGQGDCVIIRTPFNRRVMMIDTGGRLNFGGAWQTRPAARDLATRTSLNYLQSRGISHLDAVWLSHKDTDHIGYLSTVLKTVRVDRIFVPAGMDHAEKLRSWTRGRVPVIPVTDQSPGFGGLRVYHPFRAGSGTNDDSMVLGGRFGGQAFLFTGDLPKAGEAQVLDRYPGLRADVLKLGHHGSRTATRPATLRQLGVRVAIISAGRHNRYGHPAPATVATLEQAGIRTYSTQTQGMISYRYHGTRGSFWSRRTPAELDDD